VFGQISAPFSQTRLKISGLLLISSYPWDDSLYWFLATYVSAHSQSTPAPVDLYSAESSSTAIAGRGQQLSSSAGAIQTVLNNRWYVAMVIALIGPLGLPALWFSPRFSRRSKIAGTLVFVVMTTVVPLAVAWYFLDHRLRPVVEALGG